MTAEAEQLIFYVQNERLSPLERAGIEDFSVRMAEALFGPRDHALSGPPVQTKDTFAEVSAPYAVHLMQRYEENLVALSALRNKLAQPPPP